MEYKIYFISYTKKNENWATWIAEVIERHGGKALIQAWDIQAGDDFVLAMHKFLQECDICVPVLSQAYFDSTYCNAEWAGAFAADAKNDAKKMIPVRVTDVEPDGLLKSKVYIDLFGNLDEATATERLLTGLGMRNIERKSGKGFPLGMFAKKIHTQFPGGVPLNNLPKLDRDFLGREDKLAEIREAFRKSNIVCIAGLGGMGKTQLALKYAHRFADEYQNVIWWIRAEEDAKRYEDCRKFLRKAEQIVEGQELKEEVLVERLNDWQDDHDPWLFIFDNVESAGDILPYLSRNINGHVLITAQDQRLHSRIQNAVLVELDVFTHEDAMNFMCKQLSESAIGDGNAVETLIKRLSGFPLALKQATAYMDEKANNCDCAEYLELLNEHGLEVFEDDDFALPNYRAMVTTTWRVAIDKISEPARQLLYLCAYMDAERIPLEFFVQQREVLSKLLCSELGDKLKVKKVVRNLVQYAFVEPMGGFLNIHRLVQDVVRSNLHEDHWLSYCLEAAIAAMPEEDSYNSRESRDWFARVSAHAIKIANHAETNYSQNHEKEEQVALLYYLLGVGNLKLAVYEQSVVCFEKALVLRMKTLGKKHPDVAKIYNNIGWVYRRQRNYKKSMDSHMNALAIYEEVLGKEHPETATTYYYIAWNYERYGGKENYLEAVEWYKKALVIQEKVLGEEHQNTAATYSNIAMAYYRLEDYDNEALELYRKALVVREGKEHPDTADTYAQLALLYHRQNNYDKALEWNLKALVIREKILGKEHPDTAMLYNNMALVYYNKGDSNKSLELIQDALSIDEKVLGKEHKDTVMIRKNFTRICAKS